MSSVHHLHSCCDCGLPVTTTGMGNPNLVKELMFKYKCTSSPGGDAAYYFMVLFTPIAVCNIHTF